MKIGTGTTETVAPPPKPSLDAVQKEIQTKTVKITLTGIFKNKNRPEAVQELSLQIPKDSENYDQLSVIVFSSVRQVGGLISKLDESNYSYHPLESFDSIHLSVEQTGITIQE